MSSGEDMLRQGLHNMASSPPNGGPSAGGDGAPVTPQQHGGDYSSWRLPDRIGDCFTSTALMSMPEKLVPSAATRPFRLALFGIDRLARRYAYIIMLSIMLSRFGSCCKSHQFIVKQTWFHTTNLPEVSNSVMVPRYRSH